MTRLEKCKTAIEKGFKYDAETGKIFGVKGLEIQKKVNGYLSITLFKDGKRHYLYGHQFAWFVSYGTIVLLIDHVNRIKTDNRLENLRSVNKSLNAINNNAKGFSKCRRSGKFESYIHIGGKKKFLGYHETASQASEAYTSEKQNII